MNATGWVLLGALSISLDCGACLGQVAPRVPSPDPTPSPAAARPTTPPRAGGKAGYGGGVRAAVNLVLDQLQENGNFVEARTSLVRLFDGVVVHAPLKEAEAFREAALALRLVTQLEQAPATCRGGLLTYLRANEKLASTLAFLVSARDDVGRVYALLDRLRAEHGDQLNEYATLTAAICVVFDQHPGVSTSTSTRKKIVVELVDPLAVFEYFSRNEKRMAMGIRGVPADLLVYVVDVTEPASDLAWALDKYKGDRKIGERYFDVKYDYSYLQQGASKGWVGDGWSLPNLLKHGGVCEDRAYFAAGIAKANGAPAAYVRGRDGTVSHAWVAFLEARGKAVNWNFSVGRFGEYEAVRGEVVDPQTGERTADSFTSLLAESVVKAREQREQAAGYIDAAARLYELTGKELPAPPAGVAGGARSEARTPGVASSMEVLEAGLRKSPAEARGWLVLRSLAEDKGFTTADKRRWAQVLDNLCGKDYPDFSLAILRPMIEGIEDIEQRDSLWEWVYKTFSARADLAAQVRFAQGEMWGAAGDNAKAWKCYQDVVARPNAGPFVVKAVSKCEGLLREAGKDREVLGLYQAAWSKLARPDAAAPEFFMQSNWFNLGAAYADLLEKSGRAGEAAKVKALLGVGGK